MSWDDWSCSYCNKDISDCRGNCPETVAARNQHNARMEAAVEVLKHAGLNVEAYANLDDNGFKYIGQLLALDVAEALIKLEARIAEIKDMFPWDRNEPGLPDVPVRQERYDKLKAAHSKAIHERDAARADNERLREALRAIIGQTKEFAGPTTTDPHVARIWRIRETATAALASASGASAAPATRDDGAAFADALADRIERECQPEPWHSLIGQRVGRRSDMDPDARLVVYLHDDGDVGVILGSEDVEFCVPGTGGGRSPRTVDALRTLAAAMRDDNESDPRAAATTGGDAEPTTAQATLLDRLKLLASRVRATYGRAVLRSCGLDDMQAVGIVLIDSGPSEFEPGTRLPPAPVQPQADADAHGDSEGLVWEGGRP